MAQKILYSASLPVSGGAQDFARAQYKRNIRDKEKHGIVPYFVSGPLSNKTEIVGIVGGLLHVLTWIGALVVDIFLLQKIKPEDDSDKAVYDLFLSSFIPFIVAFALVVITTLLHAVGAITVKEGGYPPFLMTVLTGGTFVCLVFQFLLVRPAHRNLTKCTFSHSRLRLRRSRLCPSRCPSTFPRRTPASRRIISMSGVASPFGV